MFQDILEMFEGRGEGGNLVRKSDQGGGVVMEWRCDGGRRVSAGVSGQVRERDGSLQRWPPGGVVELLDAAGW